MPAPTWQPDPADDAYTLIHGEIRCRVWRTQDTWSALVSQRGDATAAYNFTTAAAAQAWCERLVRERQRR
jgi:hypothetical protein